jgi:hypothetical protein
MAFKIKKSKRFVVLATPKYEKSGYQSFVISPFSAEIDWNEKRAKEELAFSKDLKNQQTGLKLAETHKLKVVNINKVAYDNDIAIVKNKYGQTFGVM